MGTDKHYVPGEFYRIDDRTGFAMRARRTRKEWTNLIVGDLVWEARHPQDFVAGVTDDQSVPEPRPRQVDTWVSTGLGHAQFRVYGDNPLGRTFLVENQDGGYDPGINSESMFTNSGGTALISVLNGTDVAPTQNGYPSNLT